MTLFLAGVGPAMLVAYYVVARRSPRLMAESTVEEVPEQEEPEADGEGNGEAAADAGGAEGEAKES